MRKLVITLAILASFQTAHFASAAERKSPSARRAAEAGQKEEKRSRPLPFQGRVFQVKEASNVFITKTKAGKEHTFHLTEKSKILKDDEEATLADIKPDGIVRGSRIKLGENTWEVVKVIIGAKPKAADKAQDEDEE